MHRSIKKQAKAWALHTDSSLSSRVRTLSAVLWQWSCVNRAKHDKHHCAAFVAICEGIAKQDIAPHLTWISRLVLREDTPQGAPLYCTTLEDSQPSDFQAGEKWRGCGAPLRRFTTPGNAGRFKGFRAFRSAMQNRVADSPLFNKQGCKPHNWLCNGKYSGVAGLGPHFFLCRNTPSKNTLPAARQKGII